MLVAGFDTETTGLNLKEDCIIQVGVVLWETEASHLKAKVCYQSLVQWPRMPLLTEEVSDIHGITTSDLEAYGSPAAAVFETVKQMFSKAEYIVAHNGNGFDKPMYLSNCERLGLEPSDRPWIDTRLDIEYPANFKDRSLIYLAARHGFVNPFPHTALSDVLTMMQVADKYPWDKTIVYAKAPTLAIKAESSYQQKEIVKKQGFRWEPDTKSWVKTIKDFQYEAAKKAAQESGYTLTILKGR